MLTNLQVIYSVLAVLNITAIILVGIDKKRSLSHDDRIPEVYLFFISIFFASLGVLIGMYYFHHKTRKIYFPVGIGLLLIEQLSLIYLISKFI